MQALLFQFNLATFYNLPELLLAGTSLLFIKLALSRKSFLHRKAFLAYLGSFVVFFTFSELIYALSPNNILNLTLYELCNWQFAAVELYVLSKVLLHMTHSKPQVPARIFTVGLLLFMITGFIILDVPNTNAIGNLAQMGMHAAVLELSVLAFLCLRHFAVLAKRKQALNRHNAILALSIFAYAMLSVPFFAIGEYLKPHYRAFYNGFYTVHFIVLGLLFTAIAFYSFMPKKQGVTAAFSP